MGRINQRGFALFGDLSIQQAQSIITKTGFMLRIKQVASSETPMKSHHANPKIHPVIHAHKNTTLDPGEEVIKAINYGGEVGLFCTLVSGSTVQYS
jgi:hypothetical protein